MWKKALIVAGSLTGLMFEEGSGCSSNHAWLYGALGVGALLLLTGRLGSSTTTTTT